MEFFEGDVVVSKISEDSSTSKSFCCVLSTFTDVEEDEDEDPEVEDDVELF